MFATAISDLVQTYTGEPCDVATLVHTTSGIRNEQPVTFLYRAGTNDWSSTMPSGYTDVGNYTVQFKASAPNHDDVRGVFKVTIAPAPLAATISDVDLNYTGAAQVPAVVTNVTGLVHPVLNALTCAFRDESGEWRADVPSFTAPGTYKLYFRASAPNHETFITNCTITVAGWDYRINMDGTSGYSVPNHVSDPGWLIKYSGYTGEQLSRAADRYDILDSTCPNGLKLWQNYVLGQTNLTRKLVATILQSDSRVNANCFVVRFSTAQALNNTGLSVKYRLDRKLKGESAFTEGALGDKHELNVPLGPHDPTGLYVLNIVLAPTNSLYAGQSVLSSVATVGVMRVMSAMTNTVIAVPWGSMAFETETNAAVQVANVLNPNGLSESDEIMAYDAAMRGFLSWSHVSGNDWNAITSVTRDGLYESSASETHFDRGSAFWLVRRNPTLNGDPVPFYLIGRYAGGIYLSGLAGGSVETPGHTLVANPTFNDVDLNSFAFVDGADNPATPASGDRIITQNATGLQTIYFRNSVNTEWGYNVTTNYRGRTKQVWTKGGKIPAGTGFWYKRAGEEALRIKFTAEQ